MKIAIIDYGIGNVRSILGAFENQGANVFLTSNKDEILKSDGLVLPGVGAFSHGMENLKSYDLIDTIKEYATSDRPFMGICLGMHLLFEESEEFGKTTGLGLISGRVVKLPTKDDQNEKLPHVSWNELNGKNVPWVDTILADVEEGSDMYFVHSFIAQPRDGDNILSTTEYSSHHFCSSVKKDNIYGCQFHPEKSGLMGLKIINNFIRMCQT
ncbi:imidazole glycerol phosphate synthase subunit HisH [Candidatus Thioglobus sp.]|nr:imidazole glycerol phosphate synthase subunit HisH [Candidatus Thioglobus sp.]